MPNLKIKTRWLTRNQVLKLLEISPSTLAIEVARKRIRYRELGHRRYWAEDVERLMMQPDEL